ncbi:hypothetical protein DdX_09350 [Ditylenchus destructor]|uniref:Uncharacterized protein n=1 Tax=Ditylenchus destructor TaxID=166010 RepID=A0AAD4N0W8_9BILA|nr:hypothetical protein DdX_09350 [Ditylenchus destructor]
MNSSWSNVYFSLLLFVTVAGLAMCGLIGDRTEFNDENANRPSRFFHHPTNFDLLSPPRYEKRQSYFDSLAGQSLGKRSGPNTFRIPFREAGYRSSPDKSYEYFPNLFQ